MTFPDTTFTTGTTITSDWLNAVNLLGLYIFIGSGSPENTVSASMGSIYLNTLGGSGTSLYVKETGSGSTGWVGK